MSELPPVAKQLAFLKIQSAHCLSFQTPPSSTHYCWMMMVLVVELVEGVGVMLRRPSVVSQCLTALN